MGLQCLNALMICKNLLLQSLESLVSEDLQHRIAAFDSCAAQHAARLAAERKRLGRPVDMRDTFIAGIVLAQGATLGDFADHHPPCIEDLRRSWWIHGQRLVRGRRFRGIRALLVCWSKATVYGWHRFSDYAGGAFACRRPLCPADFGCWYDLVLYAVHPRADEKIRSGVGC